MDTISLVPFGHIVYAFGEKGISLRVSSRIFAANQNLTVNPGNID
jgi:hypothetical protein